jgi:hypothetical protein
MGKFEIITINDINQFPIPDGSVIKKRNHHVKIYYDSKDKIYIKKYQKPLDESDSQFLYNLLTTQKFRERFTPHLTAIIVLEKIIESQKILLLCGYITIKGRTVTHSEMLSYLGDIRTRNMWKKAMKKYKFYYNDFKLANVIIGKNKIGMIDLEAFRPLHRIKKLGPNSKIKLRLFDLGWYFTFLQNIKIQKH